MLSITIIFCEKYKFLENSFLSFKKGVSVSKNISKFHGKSVCPRKAADFLKSLLLFLKESLELLKRRF